MGTRSDGASPTAPSDLVTKGYSDSGRYPGYTAPSGAYQPPSNLVTSGSATFTSGQCSWVPIDVGPAPKTYNGIGVVVGTAVAGGTTPALRLGLYNDDGTGGKPGTLLLDAGTVTITATGIQVIAITQLLNPGRYWMAALYTHTAAPTTALAVQQLSAAIGLPGNTWTNDYRCYLSTGNAAGAMPASGSAAAPSVTGGVTVGLRAA